MHRFEDMGNSRTLAQDALVGRSIHPREGRARGRDGEAGRQPLAAAGDPCDILQRLAQAIQLMRLDHGDAHFYLKGCETLVRQAIEASRWSGLKAALAQIMRLVEQGDYHWALIELRTISQPEWHRC
jgi:hypothetical protein